VTLGKPVKVFWSDIYNAPFVYNPRRDMSGINQVPQPLRGVWVELVVISCHVDLMVGGRLSMLREVGIESRYTIPHQTGISLMV
jgi:hypothetical protein